VFPLIVSSSVLFTAADGVTKLNHQVERYNAASGELAAWLRVNLSSTADTRVYLYYGNGPRLCTA
jgi:hypothetical protein